MRTATPAACTQPLLAPIPLLTLCRRASSVCRASGAAAAAKTLSPQQGRAGAGKRTLGQVCRDPPQREPEHFAIHSIQLSLSDIVCDSQRDAEPTGDTTDSGRASPKRKVCFAAAFPCACWTRACERCDFIRGNLLDCAESGRFCEVPTPSSHCAC